MHPSPSLDEWALTTHDQIEQFIESIFPTQDPKKVAAVVAANRPPAEEHNLETKEAIFLILTILGVLGAVGGVMVGSPFPLYSHLETTYLLAST